MYSATIHELGDEAALLSLASWWYSQSFSSLEDVVSYMKTDSHMIQKGWHTEITDTTNIKGFLGAFCGDAYDYHFTDDHKLIPPLEHGVQYMGICTVDSDTTFEGRECPLWVASYVDDEMDIVYREFFSEEDANEFLQSHSQT